MTHYLRRQAPTSPGKLLQIIRHLDRSLPPGYDKLVKAQKEADQDFRKFQNTHPTYKRLHKAAVIARKRRYDAEERHRKKFTKKVLGVRNMILLYGAVPKVVRAVEELLKLSSPGE